MKEVFVQYVAYNAWANDLLLSTAQTLPEDVLRRELASSFAGVYRTMLHMLDAESMWWQRIKLQEQVIRPSDSFTGNFLVLASEIRKQNKLWVEYVNGLTEHGLQHEFIYRNQKKERFKQPVFQVLLHLLNHNTYHRGQLVTMLRQLGLEKLPPTDFIVWCRK